MKNPEIRLPPQASSEQEWWIHNEKEILGFRGDYYFLSNFYPCRVRIGRYTFESSEAAFQAMKSNDPDVHKLFQTMGPGEAKFAGKKLQLRPGWEESLCNEAMAFIVFEKFRQNKELRTKLIETGEKYLEELNPWKDTRWGTVFSSENRREGENRLGLILMAVRSFFGVLASIPKSAAGKRKPA